MNWDLEWVKSQMGIGDRSPSDGHRSNDEPANLFQCRDCERTFVSREMDSCPSCNGRVTHVPNERDLGII